MNKIAIIGNSPIMLILANFLQKKKKQHVTIIKDKKNIGGAWSYFKFRNKLISNQTNVIVPANKYEDRFQESLNKTLKKHFFVKIENSQGFHKPNVYLAKKNYRYFLDDLYKTEKKFEIINKYVKKVRAFDDRVQIGKDKFDTVFLPYFNGIKELDINGKAIILEPNIIRSKHIMLIFKKLEIDDFIYTENFDEIFDRAQITRFKSFVSFTARVRKPYKDKNLNSLIKLSTIDRHVSKNNLLLKRVCKYKNYYRDERNVDILKRNLDGTRIKLINTWQFYEGFLELNKKYLKYF